MGGFLILSNVLIKNMYCFYSKKKIKDKNCENGKICHSKLGLSKSNLRFIKREGRKRHEKEGSGAFIRGQWGKGFYWIKRTGALCCEEKPIIDIRYGSSPVNRMPMNSLSHSILNWASKFFLLFTASFKKKAMV